MNRALILAMLVAPGLASVVDAQSSLTILKNKTGAVVETTLDEIRATPDAYKEVWVKFPIQFCSMGKISNPFFTQFVPSEYANFYAWSAAQPIWRREAYDDVFGCLFVHKGNPVVEELYKFQTYQRFMCTGVVQNTFQEKPWIEVTEVEPMPQQVDTATLAHLYRAEMHMSRREWNQAISELSMAPADNVPNFVQSAVHKNLGVCYLRIGEAGVAQEHLQAAVQYQETRDRETEQLAQLAETNPRQALDRDVNRSEVSSADRPMWEAFEDAEAAAPQR